MSTLKIHSYETDDIAVHYDVKRCIHAEKCIHALPVVFDRNQRPWIQPQNAAVDELSAVIVQCPTGALTFTRTDGVVEADPDTNVITLEKDGPVYVRAKVEWVDADGNKMARLTRLALCRCGASKNKPFCDNEHLEIGFKAPGDLAPEQANTEEIEITGVLTVQPYRNGPVGILGNVEIRSESSGLVFRSSETYLCRCGGSSNKPFCDKTHRTNGFTAE